MLGVSKGKSVWPWMSPWPHWAPRCLSKADPDFTRVGEMTFVSTSSLMSEAEVEVPLPVPLSTVTPFICVWTLRLKEANYLPRNLTSLPNSCVEWRFQLLTCLSSSIPAIPVAKYRDLGMLTSAFTQSLPRPGSPSQFCAVHTRQPIVRTGHNMVLRGCTSPAGWATGLWHKKKKGSWVGWQIHYSTINKHLLKQQARLGLEMPWQIRPHPRLQQAHSWLDISCRVPGYTTPNTSG